jgi:hypothetical protein
MSDGGKESGWKGRKGARMTKNKTAGRDEEERRERDGSTRRNKKEKERWRGRRGHSLWLVGSLESHCCNMPT